MNNGLNLFAEALVFVHGTAAEQEAAKHALLCERLGEDGAAQTWRLLQRKVREVKPQPPCPSRKAA